MVRIRWNRVMRNLNTLSWPCDRLLRTAVLSHLGTISLYLPCFVAPAQMSHIWEKLTGQAVSQWEIFSK